MRYTVEPAALKITVQESFLIKRNPINRRIAKDSSMSQRGMARTVPAKTASAFPPRKPRKGEYAWPKTAHKAMAYKNTCGNPKIIRATNMKGVPLAISAIIATAPQNRLPALITLVDPGFPSPY